MYVLQIMSYSCYGRRHIFETLADYRKAMKFNVETLFEGFTIIVIVILTTEQTLHAHSKQSIKMYGFKQLHDIPMIVT